MDSRCHQADFPIFQMAEPISWLITQHVMHVPALCFIPLPFTGYSRFVSFGSQTFVLVAIIDKL